MKQIKKWMLAWGTSAALAGSFLQPIMTIQASEPILVTEDNAAVPAAVQAAEQKAADQTGPDSQEAAVQTAAQAEPEIAAPSAILMEASTGQVVYEKNADESRSPASITKIMTLILIFDALESGRIKLTDEVVTSAYAKSMGGSQVFLEAGAIIGRKELFQLFDRYL